MSLASLFHYLMLNVFRMWIHPSPGACDLFVELFHGLYCCGTMFVVWCPDSGFSLLPDTTPPQPNHTVTPAHIVPEQYNPWNNSTNKSQAPEDGCINIRNMLSMKKEIKRQVTSSWSLFIQLCVCFYISASIALFPVSDTQTLVTWHGAINFKLNISKKKLSDNMIYKAHGYFFIVLSTVSP